MISIQKNVMTVYFATVSLLLGGFLPFYAQGFALYLSLGFFMGGIVILYAWEWSLIENSRDSALSFARRLIRTGSYLVFTSGAIFLVGRLVILVTKSILPPVIVLVATGTFLLGVLVLSGGSLLGKSVYSKAKRNDHEVKAP